MTTKIEPIRFEGHTFFPGADRMSQFEEGFFFYMVAYQWQNGPGHVGGSSSTYGIVVPKDRTQYGQLVNHILDFVRKNGMGRQGYQVVQFFHVYPHTEYRDPVVLAQEQAAREQVARKELSH